MKKKELEQCLLNNGFVFSPEKQMIKEINGFPISIVISNGLFGSISMIGIYYHFNKELPLDDNLLDEIFQRADSLIGDVHGFELGALDTLWISGTIFVKELKVLDAGVVIDWCEYFIDKITPIIKEYEL